MKLIQTIDALTATKAPIQEATGPIPYECILDNIIQGNKSGKDLDSYEVFCLANLSWFFGEGYTSTEGQMDGMVKTGSTATTTEVVEYIKSLDAEDIVTLATEFQYLILAGNKASPVAINHLTGMTTNEWIRYVLQRQN